MDRETHIEIVALRERVKGLEAHVEFLARQVDDFIAWKAAQGSGRIIVMADAFADDSPVRAAARRGQEIVDGLK